MSVRFGVTLSLLLTAAVFGPAPASSSAPALPSAGLYDVTVETGSCNWYCGAKKYRTAAACDLACSEPCEDLCW